MNRLEQNVYRTLLVGFFQVFLVIMPVAVPFFQSKGLSMQEVFTLQAVFGLGVLLTEVPSGYLADILGRRNTLIVGTIVGALGHSCLLFADGFWGLALFEIALAISHSLVSGADLALLYDTELALGKSEQEQRQVVGKLFSARNFSESVAAISCTVIMLYGTFADLVLLQVLVAWIPVLLVTRLVEPPGARLANDAHMQNMVVILRYLATHSKVLRLVFLALSIWSLTTFYAVWLLQQLWQEQGIALAHFGWLWAGLSLMSAIAGRWAHKLEEWFGAAAVLAFVGLAPAIGYVGMGSFGVVGGLLASTTFFVSRGIGIVVLRDALNARIPSEFRATANSLSSFAFRGAFVATGPIVGWVFDLWGMDVALNMLVVVTLVIFFGLMLPLIAAVRAQQSTSIDVIVKSEP